MYDYTIKNVRRAKGVRITIYADSRVTVTKPRWVSKKFAEAFVQEKHEWIVEQVTLQKENKNNILSQYGEKAFKEQKENARKLVDSRIRELNRMYGFEYGKISIRNQRTRWGSCSRKGNLSFNFKIVYLPQELQDYLIVHELCHIKHMNHGKAFWECVSKAIPDYRQCSKRLRGGGV